MSENEIFKPTNKFSVKIYVVVGFLIVWCLFKCPEVSLNNSWGIFLGICAFADIMTLIRDIAIKNR